MMRYATVLTLFLAAMMTACGSEDPLQDGQPAAKNRTLVEILAEEREDGELLMLLPGELIDSRVAKELTDAGQKFEKVRKPRTIRYQFYTNNLIQAIRSEPSRTMWMAYDTSDPDLVTYLDGYFLDRHKVIKRYQLGDVRLAHVANEMVGGGSSGLELERLDAEVSGFVTGLAIDATGEWMFVTVKGGTFSCYSMKDMAVKCQILRLPSLRKNKEGVFTGGESGLIGLVLHPDFANNRRVFLHYNFQNAEKVKTARIAEYTLAEKSDGFSVANERIIVEFSQPHTDHNGGDMVFGPDGLMYFGVGDGLDGKWTIGRAPAAGQRGKIFRIDVDNKDEGLEYAVPLDNPFISHAEIPPETWAWGFRNPWRLSMLPDGRLMGGDIGEDRAEEITFIIRGRHHGWPYFEGKYQRNPWTLEGAPVRPLVAYERSLGNSVIAGREYRGKIGWLRGKYVFGDHLTGRIWAVELPTKGDEDAEPLGGAELLELGRWPELLTTFAEGVDRELYVGCARGVFRLVPSTGDTQDAKATEVQPLDDETARTMFEVEIVAPPRESISADEIALGRVLYSDKRLSKTGKVSCATCHPLDNFGQNGTSAMIQVKGKQQQRNTLSTFNSHRQFAQFVDYRAETVEMAVLDMLKTGNGFGDPAELLAALQQIPGVPESMKKVYPSEDPVSPVNAVRALGAFLRQLATKSRWDEYLDGRDDALTLDEKKGLTLFVMTGCISCHQYRTLGGGMSQRLGLMQLWSGEDKGRSDFSGVETEEYYFKVPALLNVAKTGPYYHDGSVKTLREAIVHMAKVQLNRDLTPEQVRLLVEFMKALTGEKPVAAR